MQSNSQFWAPTYQDIVVMIVDIQWFKFEKQWPQPNDNTNGAS